MRVLFSCRPGFGHFHPLVPLASALLEAGHKVRFACSPEMVAVIQRTGFDAEAVGLTDAESRARRVEVPEFLNATPSQLRSLAFPRVFADLEVPSRLQGMLEVAHRFKPELMVHEMAEFAGPIVAAILGIPSANHSFGPLVAKDIMLEAGVFAAKHWRNAGLPVPDRAGMYDGLYIDVCPPSLQEAHIPTVARVQPIRPGVFVEGTEGSIPPWIQALGKRPVVTVTLGTVFNKRPDLYQAIIAGLSELDLDGVVALGPGVDTTAFTALPENVRVFPWVPWNSLLEKTTLVIGHGGANSMLGPLSKGIPLVVIPLGADHFVNAARIAQAQAGIILEAVDINPRVVRDAVERALSPHRRAAAQRIAQEIAAMPSPLEVVPLLERYLRQAILISSVDERAKLPIAKGCNAE
jgi:UDP:flavonoid glycosyltransferase YjiC (YdhE family)